MDELLELGFLTGSRAFGTEKEDSDFDIVISIKNMQKVLSIIEGKEITESNYFKGFYIDDNSKKINIIPVHPKEYIPWEMATVAVSAILKKAEFTQEQKYALFQGIRSLVLMSDCKLIDEGNQ